MPNSPRSLAVPVRTRPVPLLVTVTEAPDTMAPVLSSTVTLIVPVDTCAFTGSEVKTESENSNAQTLESLICKPLIKSLGRETPFLPPIKTRVYTHRSERDTFEGV